MNYQHMALIDVLQVRNDLTNKHVIMDLVESCLGTTVMVRMLRTPSLSMFSVFQLFFILWKYSLHEDEWRTHTFSPNKRARLTLS